MKVQTNGITDSITVLGGKGIVNNMKKLRLEDLTSILSMVLKKLELPFSIKLNDFIAEKYPGTEKSYSSFMSKVSIKDTKPFDYDIYMNHVLDHKGYRFFQASFDPDEKGTVLSVNHDFGGLGSLMWDTFYFI